MNQENSNQLRTWQDIVTCARDISRRRLRKVVVAAAEDLAVLTAVSDARAQGIADAILVGDQDTILKLGDQHELDLSNFQIESAADVNAAAARAADLAAAREADIIMKGFLPTSVLLKAVLDKKRGLRRTEVISHCAILSLPSYPKLLNVTDGGMVVKPDFNQKLKIIENAVAVSRSLGIDKPRIALLAATDVVNPHMPRAIEDAVIAKMADRGQISHAIVDGPLSLDAATLPEVAKFYQINSPVAGQADVLVASSIEEGNIISKSLILFGGAVFCGIIVGAAVPVSLVSRSDPPRNKLASIALAVIFSDYLQKQEVMD
ncbi:bifunctional enoyl-CoA hydratase/phosphate acetyltransferase [bacterium]|nr:bifunctional enoyl-CoA hydratase/phosphate acetyltransferase [bacterium]MBU1651997.1 bifunctional enoyl-CoA hydratase/phosphate acetyltransferase [bacterium]MBU1882173.1 bifunctional enoyl-CoA hydratase/phosphate acetyltransferase [bacterium]